MAEPAANLVANGTVKSILLSAIQRKHCGVESIVKVYGDQRDLRRAGERASKDHGAGVRAEKTLGNTLFTACLAAAS